MTSKTSARNTTQRAGGAFTVSGRVTNNATPLYTVPAGKQARLTGVIGRVDNVGSDSEVAIARKPVSGSIVAIGNFATAVAGDNLSQCVQTVFQTGEGLTTVGIAGGTNATIDISSTVEEFDI